MRKQFRHLRKKTSSEESHLAGKQAASYFSESALFLKHTRFACYLANDHEFPCQPIIDLIWQKGSPTHCYLPVLAQKQLMFAEYHAHSRMAANRYKILEPQETTLISPPELDVVLMPLVAFDLKGNRLGMGGGYYDRTFEFLLNSREKKPQLIGLAFEYQKASDLPQEAWDVPLDGVLTEKGLRLLR